ncbi:MAG: hypothetical protein WCI45_00205, partial [Desulfuromonadales bacterium]
MLYQILTGNVNSLGLTTSPGTSIVVKPLVVPQMVQGSLITLDQQSASVDNTGSFSIQIAQTAKVRLVVTDGAGRQCGDIQLHITDDATADISQYLQSPPPDPLRNMYINAQLSAESAYESKILAGYQAADAQSAATTASTQAGIATTKAGEA